MINGYPSRPTVAVNLWDQLHLEEELSQIVIRDAVKADAPHIYQFIIDLAIYEKAEHEVISSVEQLEKTLFAENDTLQALMAEDGGTPVGFAVYFKSYSTWLGKYGIFLEDLYVNPDSRGKGIGTLLLKRLAEIAVENDCGRLEWNVLTWNEPALKFYQAMGAEPMDEWIRYRLDGDRLVGFAKGNASD